MIVEQSSIWIMAFYQLDTDRASPCIRLVMEFIIQNGFSSVRCGFYQILMLFTRFFPLLGKQAHYSSLMITLKWLCIMEEIDFIGHL